jgi:hypothetical protein
MESQDNDTFNLVVVESPPQIFHPECEAWLTFDPRMSWYGRDLEKSMGQGINGASYDTGSLFYRRYTEIVDFTLESDASIIQPDEHMSRPVTQMFCRASNTNGEQNVLWNLRDYLEKLAESGLQLGKVETLSLKCGSHKRE